MEIWSRVTDTWLTHWQNWINWRINITGFFFCIVSNRSYAKKILEIEVLALKMPKQVYHKKLCLFIRHCTQFVISCFVKISRVGKISIYVFLETRLYGWERWKTKLERMKKFLHKIHHTDQTHWNMLLRRWNDSACYFTIEYFPLQLKLQMINKLKDGGFLVVITVTGSSLHKSKKTRLSQTEMDERGAKGKKQLWDWIPNFFLLTQR